MSLDNANILTSLANLNEIRLKIQQQLSIQPIKLSTYLHPINSKTVLCSFADNLKLRPISELNTVGLCYLKSTWYSSQSNMTSKEKRTRTSYYQHNNVASVLDGATVGRPFFLGI